MSPMKVVIMGMLLLVNSLSAAPAMSPATKAINGLGIDLLSAANHTNENFLLSPYSIQTALAMTYAGAAGVTREQMKRKLHYPDDAAELHKSFAELQTQFSDAVAASAKLLEKAKKNDQSFTPLSLSVANRLYAQRGYEFKPNYLTLLKKNYETSLEQVDFKMHAPQITTDINKWVEEQTKKKIRDLIPPGALSAATRLVLVNALYFKNAWANTFAENATTPAPFKVPGQSSVKVPTMSQVAKFGYMKFPGGEAVAMPYRGDDFQFVILLPNANESLGELQTKLTDKLLQRCAFLRKQDVYLHLPKFKFEPPTITLSSALKSLGMKSAFDEPPGSADFSEMAVRRPNDYLAISQVFHKTFIAVDEEGTEAAAATAVVMMMRGMAAEPPKPIEIKVDRPFIFAIQHRASGACLFLGQVVDPRGN